MTFTGKNMRAMASVATNVGIKSSLALAQAASMRSIPRPSLSIYPSMVMMESSTIMPRQVIRAASVTVFRSIPVTYMMHRAMAVIMGSPDDAMRALLSGNSKSITRMTTSMEMIRSRMKLKTESPTTLGWSVILVMVTLCGSSLRKSASTRSTSRPNAVISFPGRDSSDITTQGVPL